MGNPREEILKHLVVGMLLRTPFHQTDMTEVVNQHRHFGTTTYDILEFRAIVASHSSSTVMSAIERVREHVLWGPSERFEFHQWYDAAGHLCGLLQGRSGDTRWNVLILFRHYKQGSLSHQEMKQHLFNPKQ